jgi:hypothetical protein
MEKKYKRFLDQFISAMEMPCYEKCSNFYYYDVLEALSRHLFETIIKQKKKRLDEELASSDSESDDDRQPNSPGNMSNQSSQPFDSESSFNEQLYDLTEREIEDREDILRGSLDAILRRLEEKGAEQPEIEKYKEMRVWRMKRDKTVREQLEQFTIESKDGEKRRSIIDSSQLVGARVIQKYYKRSKAR